MRSFNWSNEDDNAWPKGVCFSASVNCLYCTDNSMKVLRISARLPVAVFDTVSI